MNYAKYVNSFGDYELLIIFYWYFSGTKKPYWFKLTRVQYFFDNVLYVFWKHSQSKLNKEDFKIPAKISHIK